MTNLLLLVARIALSVIFIGSGIEKFGNIEGTAAYISSAGLPAPVALAWLSGIFETVAGIAVLLGFLTRYAAWALAAFCVVAGLSFHLKPDDPMEMISLMKDMAIAGGFLALSVAGAGAWSIDGRRGV